MVSEKPGLKPGFLFINNPTLEPRSRILNIMPIFRGSQFVSSISDFKDSVVACATTNVNLATTVSSIDGVSLVKDDRVLLTAQSLARENGIYMKLENGTLTRAKDADSAIEITAGLKVYVEQGSTESKSHWLLTNTGSIVVGTTNLTFEKTSQIASSLSGQYGGLNKVITVTVNSSGSITAISESAVTLTNTINGQSGTVILGTDDVTEGIINQYFTTARARSSISAGGDLTYNSVTGAISYTTPTTDGVNEGSTNLYHTTARVRNSLSASGVIGYNTGTGVITYNPASLTIGNGLTGTGYDTSLPVTIEIDTNTVVTVSGTQTLDNKTIDGGTF